MTRKPVALALFALALAFSAAAVPLVSGEGSPTVDGRISSGEYPSFQSYNGIEFGAALGKDGVLTLAVRAPTSGWVALGLGSGFMDGSWILMAYDKGGDKAFSEQLGISHFHQPVKETKILAKAVGHEGGLTTLEFQVRASEFVKNGRLPVIMAFGRAANFSSYHERHASTLLTF